jgi:hypothetical protein
MLLMARATNLHRPSRYFKNLDLLGNAAE